MFRLIVSFGFAVIGGALIAIAVLAVLAPKPMGGAFQSTANGTARVALSTAASPIAVAGDPISAMAYADTLPVDERADFVDAVAAEWALVDPEGFLTYAGARSRIENLGYGLVHASITLPQQVLEIAARHPSIPVDGERTLEEVAISVIAERAPAAALAHLDTLAAGDRYLAVRGAIAESWARADPEGALAWARDLRPTAPGVVATVIAHTAARDIEAALDLLEAFDPPPDHPAVQAGVATPQAIARIIVSYMASNSQRTRYADRLSYRRTPGSLIALRELIALWVQVDAVAAIDWLNHANDRVSPALHTELAIQFAATDVRAAMVDINRLSPDARLLWAMQVMPRLASVDPHEAAQWLAQFQGSAEYESLFLRTVQYAGILNPDNVAVMLSTVPVPEQMTGTPISIEIVQALARTDPNVALAWTQSVPDGQERVAALTAIGATWITMDPGSAQQWVLDLPADDAARERVATFMVVTAVSTGIELDSGFVRSLGLDDNEVPWATYLVREVAMRNPIKARALVDEWITDPEFQRQTAQEVEAMLARYSLVPL